MMRRTGGSGPPDGGEIWRDLAPRDKMLAATWAAAAYIGIAPGSLSAAPATGTADDASSRRRITLAKTGVGDGSAGPRVNFCANGSVELSGLSSFGMDSDGITLSGKGLVLALWIFADRMESFLLLPSDLREQRMAGWLTDTGFSRQLFADLEPWSRLVMKESGCS